MLTQSPTHLALQPGCHTVVTVIAAAVGVQQQDSILLKITDASGDNITAHSELIILIT